MAKAGRYFRLFPLSGVALNLQFIAGLLPSLDCEENADVNVDGNTNSIDVALILQFIAGLLDTLPP